MPFFLIVCGIRVDRFRESGTPFKTNSAFLQIHPLFADFVVITAESVGI